MNPPFLLDTCAAIWIVAGEIADSTAEALSASREAGLLTYVSPITAWEVGILARKGRFRSRYTPQNWFDRLIGTPDVGLCELTPKVLIDSSFLPGTPPTDPADRIIAATARECGFTVMTRDRLLLNYASEGYLAAFEC